MPGDGSLRDQIAARARLAVELEKQGMLADAIALLETNLALGAADEWHYAQLLQLYRGYDAGYDPDVSLATERVSPVDPDRVPGHPWSQADSSPDLAASPGGPDARTHLATGRTAPQPASAPEPVGSSPPAVGGSRRDAWRLSAGSTPAVLAGGVVGILGATLLFSTWNSDWRPLLLASRGTIALLLAWRLTRVAHGHRSPRQNSVWLPTTGGLAMLALLTVVLWQDARIGTSATSDALAEQTVASSVMRSLHEPGSASSVPTVSGVPTLISSPGFRTATVDGVLVVASPTAPNQGPASTPHATSLARRPDLLVADAAGGVWLRDAPARVR